MNRILESSFCAIRVVMESLHLVGLPESPFEAAVVLGDSLTQRFDCKRKFSFNFAIRHSFYHVPSCTVCRGIATVVEMTLSLWIDRIGVRSNIRLVHTRIVS